MALTVLVVPMTSRAATISEVRTDQTGTDNDEYFELQGLPSESLNDLTFITIGDGTGGSGVIEEVTVLTGQSIQATGFFVAAEGTFTLGTANLVTTLDFENSDNVTHLLVNGFTGAVAQDLDTNNDGVLDVLPWTSIVDCVAMILQPNPPTSTEYEYATGLGYPAIGPDGTFAPGHIYRHPGTGAWQIGQFDIVGGDDTPGGVNVPVELASFSAHAGVGTVELAWETASELDNLGFNVYRSSDEGFKVMLNAFPIPGAGTTLHPQQYTFIDKGVTAGAMYRYWLEQVDFQGTTAMFGPVTVQVPADLPGVLTVAVSPAPVQDAAQIQLHVPRDGMARVGLYDLQGRQVRTVWSGPVQAGATTVNFDRDGLGSGLYVLRAITSCGLVSQAVVLD
jgi:hypothetical protein